MAVVPHKVRRNGKEYYELIEGKRVNGKVVQKYKGYIGKGPEAKNELKASDILPYVERLLKHGISQEDIYEILKKLEIEYNAWPITKIII